MIKAYLKHQGPQILAHWAFKPAFQQAAAQFVRDTRPATKLGGPLGQVSRIYQITRDTYGAHKLSQMIPSSFLGSLPRLHFLQAAAICAPGLQANAPFDIS